MKKLFVPVFAATALLAVGAAQADADLATKRGCMACHKVDQKLVGPAYKEVAAKYQDDADAVASLTAKVKAGGSGVWGPVPMPPNAHVPEEDIQAIVSWIMTL